MGTDLVAESARAREIFQRADEILGYSLTGIMAASSDEELHRTVHTQPAVFVHSMALWEVAQEQSPVSPTIAAGHSLGEYSALCAAGVLRFEDALEVIRVRAVGMDGAQPLGTCGMAAILGLDKERVIQIVDVSRGDGTLEAANFNAPDQTVISGDIEAVRRAVGQAKKERRAKTVMLPVSSAFHTRLMDPARDLLAERLQDISFGRASFPVVANVNAQPYPQEEDGIRKLLLDQVVSPVLWQECVATMKRFQEAAFVEIGPGKVLSGLLRRIDRNAVAMNICDMESIRDFQRARA